MQTTFWTIIISLSYSPYFFLNIKGQDFNGQSKKTEKRQVKHKIVRSFL